VVRSSAASDVYKRQMQSRIGHDRLFVGAQIGKSS
jgi:hypothetical protein